VLQVYVIDEPLATVPDAGLLAPLAGAAGTVHGFAANTVT